MLILVPTQIEAEMLFGRPECQRTAVGKLTTIRFGDNDVCVSLTGFGLPAAGVGASKAISQYVASCDDRQVLLAGTGGTYKESAAPIGSAVFATHIRCLDVGIPASKGPNEWTLELGDQIHRDAFRDCIDLPQENTVGHAHAGLFLSVATASRNSEMAEDRLRRNPQALVEEMEGYSTAIACHTWEAELTVCRGMSNVVGDRDLASWRFEEAMNAVRDAILGRLEQQGSTR